MRVSAFREGRQVVHREVLGRIAKNAPLSAPGFRTRAYHRIFCPFQKTYLPNGDNRTDTFQGERALPLFPPPFTPSSGVPSSINISIMEGKSLDCQHSIASKLECLVSGIFWQRSPLENERPGKIRITNGLIPLLCFPEDQLGGNKPNYSFITYKRPKKPKPSLDLDWWITWRRGQPVSNLHY